MSLDAVTMLRHGKVELALHHLRDATAAGGRPLLILHGLGEASPRSAPRWTDGWPGPVAALDFTGHGASTIPRGGGYTAELLLGDADAALESLTDGDPTRSITVVGRGLGAYIALQLAGARATQVHGAILVDGPGLAGGPTGPTSQSFFSLPASSSPPTRTRSSSWVAISVRPTTRRSSSDWHWQARTWTNRSRSPASSGRNGWTRCRANTA